MKKLNYSTNANALALSDLMYHLRAALEGLSGCLKHESLHSGLQEDELWRENLLDRNPGMQFADIDQESAKALIAMSDTLKETLLDIQKNLSRPIGAAPTDSQ